MSDAIAALMKGLGLGGQETPAEPRPISDKPWEDPSLRPETMPVSLPVVPPDQPMDVQAGAGMAAPEEQPLQPGSEIEQIISALNARNQEMAKYKNTGIR